MSEIKKIVDKNAKYYETWGKNEVAHSWCKKVLEVEKPYAAYEKVKGLAEAAAKKAAEVTPKTKDCIEYEYLAALRRDIFSRYASRKTIYAAGINSQAFGSLNVQAQLKLVE